MLRNAAQPGHGTEKNCLHEVEEKKNDAIHLLGARPPW